VSRRCSSLLLYFLHNGMDYTKLTSMQLQKKFCEAAFCKNVSSITIWTPTTRLKDLSRCIVTFFTKKAIIISMNWINKSVFAVWATLKFCILFKWNSCFKSGLNVFSLHIFPKFILQQWIERFSCQISPNIRLTRRLV
jgi:hypothetical protein